LKNKVKQKIRFQQTFILTLAGMKIYSSRNWLLAALFLAVSGQVARAQFTDPENWIFQPEDKVIFEKVVSSLSTRLDAPIGELVVETGKFFLETPYVAHTLETGEEQMVINLRELDCTTFAENCLALSRTMQSENHTFEHFVHELQYIRYRNGVMSGYPSRLHYFCDWIYNNQQKNVVRDVSEEIAHTPLSKPINFMSTHPEEYMQLEKDPLLVEILAQQEEQITARNMYYIPEEKIAEVEDLLQDGDIAGITTVIEGIAIMHVVILVRVDNRIHLLHASSSAGKVVISEGTLEDYLLGSNSANGIMVARPLPVQAD
jgi:hypothetical protein